MLIWSRNIISSKVYKVAKHLVWNGIRTLATLSTFEEMMFLDHMFEIVFEVLRSQTKKMLQYEITLFLNIY